MKIIITLCQLVECCLLICNNFLIHTNFFLICYFLICYVVMRRTSIIRVFAFIYNCFLITNPSLITTTRSMWPFVIRCSFIIAHSVQHFIKCFTRNIHIACVCGSRCRSYNLSFNWSGFQFWS